MLQAPGGRSGGEAAGMHNFLSGLSSGGSTSSGRVYMGSKQVRLEGMGFRTKDHWVSSDEAQGAFYSWSGKRQRDFLSKALLGGLLKIDDGPMEAGALWRKLVKEAAFYGKQGTKISPMDILSTYVHGSGAGGNPWVRQGDFEVNQLTGEKRYAGPQFKTTTQQHADLTDPATARAIATQIFQDLMGRNPGKGELSAFGGALGQAERSHPLVETTTTQFDMSSGEPIGSSSTTQGGVPNEAKQALAESQVKKKKEYGVVQAVTTYQNALENAVYGAPE